MVNNTFLITIEADQYNKTITGSVFNEHRFKLYGTDIVIDWGDGTQEADTNNTGEYGTSHVYGSAGIYTISITGNIIGLADRFLATSTVKVRSIIFPDTLQTIGNGCCIFDDDFTQTKIIIPEGVTTIGNSFFRGTNIEEIVLPSTLTSIGTELCKDCTSLKKATIKSRVVPTASGTTFTNCSNYKILVPSRLLNEYISNNKYPSSREYYDIYEESLAGKVYLLGTKLAENLSNQDISANANEGLKPLANKILDIGGANYQRLTYRVDYRDNNDTISRPSQFPALLSANGEVIEGCLLPRDNNATEQSTNVFSYSTMVPLYDPNDNSITYSWTPLGNNLNNYNIENVISANTYTTILRKIFFSDSCSRTPNLTNYNNGNVINLVGNCTSGTISYDNTEQAYKIDRTVNSRNDTWYIMFPITALQNKHDVIIEADIKSKHVAYNRIGFGCTDNERYVIANIGHDNWSSGLRFSYGNIGSVSESMANYSFPNDNTIWYHCKFIAENDNYICEIYDTNHTLLVSLEKAYELNETRIFGIAIGCPSTSTVYMKNIKCLHI